MNLFILICSALFSNIIKNVTNYHLLNSESSGNDERIMQSYPVLNEQINENEILYRIRKYNYYMTILNYLESTIISEKDKMERIKIDIGEDTYKIYDLYAGSLLKDWEIDF